MADDKTDTVYYSNWCMVTESIMNGCFDIYPTLCPRTNIEMWNVSETTTP